jgi:hypothetical protein
LAASKTTAKGLKGSTCIATVTSTNVRSRFCASKTAGAVNCSVAQQQHLTVIDKLSAELFRHQEQLHLV